ncbi:class I SAM-dependent methyltransferase [Nonomuraea zeae]|uniref:Methyltransferase domain-containing protein n=1 Tax=Nonomuraea zeae TaxID=1642303 RepID=A0A5S4G2Q7_9ACTN|nr:class I SAM-dependent methyltransferase [Nonomuraea zeae]TMR27295.1 methyltransferase domain-containing protein [Nonomuraea zeae]
MSLVHDRPSFDRRQLVQDAWRLYAEAPPAQRLKQRLRVLTCPFEEMIGYVPEGATVLDVGCGSGLALGLMAARGLRIEGHGFDPCPIAVGLAARMAARMAVQMAAQTGPQTGPQTHAQTGAQPDGQGDVRAGGTGSSLHFEYRDARSRWRSRTYDVVLLQDVLHQVPEAWQRGVFGKACAAVRPGGILIYQDMSARPLWRNLAGRVHDLLVARQWIAPVPIATVEEWAAEHSLVPEVSRTLHRAVYGTDLRVFGKRD